MAERQRAILVALQAVTSGGVPCETGHSVAHKISLAGHRLAVPPEPWVAGYTVFGERRLVLSVPTFMEQKESPFTKRGRARLAHLEKRVKLLSANAPTQTTEEICRRVLGSSDLEEANEDLRTQVRSLQDKVDDLEETVQCLTAQVKGKLR